METFIIGGSMNAANTIVYANFRRATEEEVSEAKGHILYRVITFPVRAVLQGVNKIIGTGQLIFRGIDARKWTTPFPQALVNRISLRAGYYEYSFLREFNAFSLGKMFFIENGEIGKSFFKHHRENEFFTIQ